MLEKMSLNTSAGNNVFRKNVLSLWRNCKKKLYKVRTISKIFVAFILLTGFPVNLFSQSTSSASIGATVVRPILIEKTADMNFETVAIIIAGEVEMVPGGVYSKKSTIMLPVPTGTFTAASFVTEGTAAYTYTITVPPSPLEIKIGDKTMIVNSFKSDPILNPGKNLFGGVYVSVTPFNVTVNYN
jgi:hypothetical protein